MLKLQHALGVAVVVVVVVVAVAVAVVVVVVVVVVVTRPQSLVIHRPVFVSDTTVP